MELIVTADDRTGALETAGVLADRIGAPVPVSVWPSVPSGRVAVTDLGTRHLSPADAGARVREFATAGRVAHKIDSTLRGNWPEELAACAAERPALLIPALPEFGRTCMDGTVLEHGRPVHHGAASTDVRRRVSTSRPATALRAAGVRVVTELSDPSDVSSWLDAPAGVAIADAGDQAEIDQLVAAWRGCSSDVVLAGTSAVVGVAVERLGSVAHRPTTTSPILVVCGSVHPAARAQIDAADRDGVPVAVVADVISGRELAERNELVLVSEIPVGDIDEPMAVAAASALASGVAALRAMVPIGALVIIGGDTAAAVLGGSAVRVQGSVQSGTAWSTAAGFDCPVITRSGGFGSDRALIELIRATLRP